MGFAHRILSPTRHVDKVYIATVDKKIDFSDAKKSFKDGIILADGTILLSADLDLISDEIPQVFKVVIKEGKYHQVRRMMASRGMTVTYLERREEGGLTLGDLARGCVRELTPEELDSLEQG